MVRSSQPILIEKEFFFSENLTLIRWIFRLIFFPVTIGYRIARSAYYYFVTLRPRNFVGKLIGEERTHRSMLRGDAQWMERKETERIFSPKNAGIVLGDRYRMSLEDSFANNIIFGPVGMGKSTRFIIRQILQCHSGSMVITDPSRELLRQTGQHLIDSGYRVDVVDFKNYFESRQFNPMAYAETPEDLRLLADDLISKVAGKDPIWTIEGVNPMHLCMVAQHGLAGKKMSYLPSVFQEAFAGAGRETTPQDPRYCNIANTLWLLEAWGPGGKGVEGFMAAHLDDYFMHKFQGICQNKDGFVQDVIATAKAGLSLWHDRRIAHLTSTDTLDLSSIRTEKRAIFVVPPDSRSSYFGQLANLFYDTLFEICYRKHGEGTLPVFFHLDEFPFLGKIPHIDDCVNTLRKYRVSINIVVQSLSQLEKTYGREGADTMLNGLSTKIFLPGIDAKNTARYLEMAAGDSTRYDTIYGFEDERAHTVKVPLISAAQARVLEDDYAVVISRNRKPARIKLIPHYRDARLKKLSKKGAGVPPPSNWGKGLAFIDPSAYRKREHESGPALRLGREAQFTDQRAFAAASI